MVRVVILSVGLEAVEGLLSSLFSFSHDRVLPTFLAGLDSRRLGTRKEGSWYAVFTLHSGVSEEAGAWTLLLLVLLIADEVGSASVDDHLIHLGDDGHGIGFRVAWC